MVKIYFRTLILILFTASLKAQVSVMNPIAGPTVVCASPSSPVTFTASASNSPTSFSYSISPSASLSISGATGDLCTISFPPSNGTYTLTVVANNASGSSAPVSLVINVFETPTVTFSGATSFCQGSSTSISASSTLLSASPTINYYWSPPTGLNTTVGPNVQASPTTNMTYTVTAVKGPCTNTAAISVTVNPLPTLSVSITNTAVCWGDSTKFTASGASTYTWCCGVNNGVSFVPYWTSTYLVYGTNSFGCTNSTNAFIMPLSPPSIMVSSNPPLACMGQSVAITMSGTSSSYTFNGTPISGNTVVVSPTITTTYTINGVTSQGCKGSAVYTQAIGCVGINDPKSKDYAGLMAYPNPSSGQFILTSGFDEVISIHNELGQLVQRVTLNAGDKITVPGLRPGVYFVSSERVRIKVIVVE